VSFSINNDLRQYFTNFVQKFEMQPFDKKERGTDIILYIDDDNKEFLEQTRIDALLKKYCRFLPMPVVSGKKQEWKDGKMPDPESLHGVFEQKADSTDETIRISIERTVTALSNHLS